MSLSSIGSMTDSDDDVDKVVVFSGHSVVKGPKSFRKTDVENDESE